MTRKLELPQRRSQPPVARPTSYPTPEERRRIIARREELLKKVIAAAVVGPIDRATINRLIARYGAAEVEIVTAKLKGPHGPFINESPRYYREYRQIFARFGGDHPFLNKKDYERLMGEFTRLLARREFDSNSRQAPGARETALHDLLLRDALMWPDLTPPATPPRAPDHVAPPAGQYADPAQKLLTWGPDLDEERCADCTRYAAWRRAAPDLERMVLDPGLLNGWPAENASWAPLHALEILGYPGAAAGPALFALLDCENDWLSDRLPKIWGRMGRGMEAILWAYLDDRQQPSPKREVSIAGLQAIADQYPVRRPPIVQGLIARLQAAPVDDQRINAYLVHTLDDMHAHEAHEAIMAAFEAGKVDTRIITPGDIE